MHCQLYINDNWEICLYHNMFLMIKIVAFTFLNQYAHCLWSVGFCKLFSYASSRAILMENMDFR